VEKRSLCRPLTLLVVNIEQHDENNIVPGGHMIPAHAKKYAQGAPIPKHKSTELPPTLRESSSG
jgi:hypothetical protein